MLKIYMPAGATLAMINAIVAQLEGADGPLTAVHTEGRATILTFDETAPKPARFAVVHPAGHGAAANGDPVCKGRIFVAGEEADYAVHRPKA